MITNWDDIKNNIAELNGINKLSPIDKTPLNNELIMCLFCNKINLKYRFQAYYEVPFLDYTTRMFNTLINENNNFFIEASKDLLLKEYIDSINNTIKTKIYTINKSENTDYNLNIDTNLLLISALENLDMNKYKILSKLLYEMDVKYLDYAKESIINSNKNKSLDKMVYGIDVLNNAFEIFSNHSVSSSYLNYFLIIIIFLLIIFILNKNK
jgi:hypothetical protein